MSLSFGRYQDQITQKRAKQAVYLLKRLQIANVAGTDHGIAKRNQQKILHEMLTIYQYMSLDLANALMLFR